MLFFKMMLMGMACVSSIYTYDRFNNKPVTMDTSFNNIYYTSNKFHSIEFTNNCNIRTNSTNSTSSVLLIRLRKPNSTVSLPNLYNI